MRAPRLFPFEDLPAVEAGELERVRFHGHTRITVRSLNALIKRTMTENILHPSSRR